MQEIKVGQVWRARVPDYKGKLPKAHVMFVGESAYSRVNGYIPAMVGFSALSLFSVQSMVGYTEQQFRNAFEYLRG